MDFGIRKAEPSEVESFTCRAFQHVLEVVADDCVRKPHIISVPAYHHVRDLLERPTTEPVAVSGTFLICKLADLSVSAPQLTAREWSSVGMVFPLRRYQFSCRANPVMFSDLVRFVSWR